MKKIILCFVILIIYGFAYGSPFRMDFSQRRTDALKKNIEKLLIAKEFNVSDLRTINELSFMGYFDLAYDICDKIKSLTKDEEYLRLVKIHQSAALVRILVANGVIDSIHQIPEESMGVFNHKTTNVTYYFINIPKDIIEEAQKELYKILTTGTEEEKAQFEKMDVTLENYKDFVVKEGAKGKMDFRNKLPEEYANEEYTTEQKTDFNAAELSDNHRKVLEQVATIALMEKYPMAVDKIFNDYYMKHGIDTVTYIMIDYFINASEYEKAIALCEIAMKEESLFTIEEKFKRLDTGIDFRTLIAVAYAKSGDLETALKISNELMAYIDTNKDDPNHFLGYGYTNRKINCYMNKFLLYKHSGQEDKYKEDMDKLMNEIIILSQEERSYVDPNHVTAYMDISGGYPYSTLFTYSYNFNHEAEDSDAGYVSNSDTGHVSITLAHMPENIIRH